MKIFLNPYKYMSIIGDILKGEVDSENKSRCHPLCYKVRAISSKYYRCPHIKPIKTSIYFYFSSYFLLSSILWMCFYFHSGWAKLQYVKRQNNWLERASMVAHCINQSNIWQALWINKRFLIKQTFFCVFLFLIKILMAPQEPFFFSL